MTAHLAIPGLKSWVSSGDQGVVDGRRAAGPGGRTGGGGDGRGGRHAGSGPEAAVAGAGRGPSSRARLRGGGGQHGCWIGVRQQEAGGVRGEDGRRGRGGWGGEKEGRN